MLNLNKCPACQKTVEFVDNEICPRCNHQLSLFERLFTFYKRLLIIFVIVLLVAFVILIAFLSIEDPQAALPNTLQR